MVLSSPFIKSIGAAMFKLNIDLNTEAVFTALEGVASRSIPYAVANAIGAAAELALDEVAEGMGNNQYIDRATPWTRRSLYKRPKRVSPRYLNVEIGFKQLDSGGGGGTPAGEYLLPMATGGTRQQKPFEKQNTSSYLAQSLFDDIRVNKTTLDFDPNQYGNLPQRTYVLISNAIQGRGKLGDFIFIRGTDIYARTGEQTKRKKKNSGRARLVLPRGLTKLFYKLNRAPRYQKSFPVSDILQDFFTDRFDAELQAAAEAEIERAFSKRAQSIIAPPSKYADR